ncbi:hypothetical protein ACRRTK_004887 [Alexandromys fortis]
MCPSPSWVLVAAFIGSSACLMEMGEDHASAGTPRSSSPWFVLFVNLTESRITWEKGLWACLGGIVLITLIEVRGLSHCDWHRSLAGILDWITEGDKQSNRMHALLSVRAKE